MKKEYNVLDLLKPIKLQETESDATDAGEPITDEEKKKAEETKNKSDDGDKENKKDEDKSAEQDKGDQNKDEQNKEAKPDKGKNDKEDKKAKAKKTQVAIGQANNNLAACSAELKTLAKNNNFYNKYGKEMKKAVNDSSKGIYIAIGIGLIAVAATLVITKLWNAKQAFSFITKVPGLVKGDPKTINEATTSVTGVALNLSPEEPVEVGANTDVSNPQNPTDANTAIAQPANANVQQPQDAADQQATNAPQEANVQAQQDQATDTEQKSEAEWKGIQQRIANKQATDEDMEYAKKQYDAGNYNNAGQATKAYFGAIDQGKSPEEAQQIADANNPKLQPEAQSTNPQTEQAQQPEAQATGSQPQAQTNGQQAPTAETSNIANAQPQAQGEPPKESITDVANQAQQVANQPKPTSTSTTTTDANGNKVTTTTSDNGQGSTATTVTSTNDNKTTQASVEKQVGGKGATAGAPIDLAKAQQTCKNCGAPENWANAIVENGLGQTDATNAISTALKDIHDLKSGKGNIDFIKRWNSANLPGNVATCTNRLVQTWYSQN